MFGHVFWFCAGLVAGVVIYAKAGKDGADHRRKIAAGAAEMSRGARNTAQAVADAVKDIGSSLTSAGEEDIANTPDDTTPDIAPAPTQSED